MANTADFDHSRRPAFAGPRHEDYHWRNEAWRPGCHPASILIVIAGFIVWWPLGLAALAYTFWSKNMGCGHRHGRFADKMERMQWKMERMRDRMDGRGFWGASSGNRAFDDYRMETLRRLEEEQKEFRDFLDRLRQAKDKEEFDAFMAQHRQRPASPDVSPGQG
jgi:hypothetical protein